MVFSSANLLQHEIYGVPARLFEFMVNNGRENKWITETMPDMKNRGNNIMLND